MTAPFVGFSGTWLNARSTQYHGDEPERDPDCDEGQRGFGCQTSKAGNPNVSPAIDPVKPKALQIAHPSKEASKSGKPQEYPRVQGMLRRTEGNAHHDHRGAAIARA